MIDAILRLGSEMVFIRVDGHDVRFSDSSGKMATIEGLKLSRSGVTKEFPDLKDDEHWRQKAIERFKQKIKELDGEDEIFKFVINDLKGYGYIPLYKQKQGFRREKFVL